jgi:hypothetical protein
MIGLTFEINGRQVDPKNMRDALEGAILQSVQDHVTHRLGTVRCPVHGAAPTVVCRGRSLNDLKFDISGCCQAGIDTATKALS